MPLRLFKSETATYDELHEAVMLAMASSYPHITHAQEARLKATLLGIIADTDPKTRDPEELMRVFQKAMEQV